MPEANPAVPPNHAVDAPAARLADSETDALTVFEFWSGGHAPNFLRLLFETWQQHGAGTLRAVVTQRMVRNHPYVFEGFDNLPGSPVRWLAIDDSDERDLDIDWEAALSRRVAVTSAPPVRGDLFWSLILKYAPRHPARHLLLMNMDQCLLPIGAGERLPADFSGILFLPAFHYSEAMTDAAFRIRVFNALQMTIVRERLPLHPQMKNIFSLDATLTDSLNGKGTAHFVWLPDPVKMPAGRPSASGVEAIRERLGAVHGRTLFLMFGDLRARKGIWKLFDALLLLSPEEQEKICLAVVGSAEPSIEERIEAWKKVIGDTRVSLIRRTGYVSDDEMHQWFDAADVVLAPYQRHVGSSGVLMLAAAHGKPVIAQDFGLIGRLVSDHGLGMCVDTRRPPEIVGALRAFLAGNPPAGWDEARATAFAEANSRERFGAILIETLKPHFS